MSKSSRSNAPDIGPRLRRGYFECRFGQLHVHNCIPPGGGFEEGTPLMCVHRAGGSGRDFAPLVSLLGRERSIYAPDLPGCGESDGPPERATLQDYAGALGDFLQSMRFRQIDVLGFQLGARIAAELAVERAQQIRRVVLISVPAADPARQDGLDQRWSRLSQPTLLMRVQDEFAAATSRVRDVLPKARWVDLPAQGDTILTAAPESMVASVKEFLAY
jgi:pimeloyl-ACP methyl ester carboxylesterase